MSRNVKNEYMLLSSPSGKKISGEATREWQLPPSGTKSSDNGGAENKRADIDDMNTLQIDVDLADGLNPFRSNPGDNWLHSALSEIEFFIHKHIPILFILLIGIALPFSKRVVMWVEGISAIIACVAGRWAIAAQNKNALRCYQFWLCFVVGVTLATLPMLIKGLKAFSIIIVLLMGLHLYQALLIHKSLNGCMNGDLNYSLTQSRELLVGEGEERNVIHVKESFNDIPHSYYSIERSTN